MSGGWQKLFILTEAKCSFKCCDSSSTHSPETHKRRMILTAKWSRFRIVVLVKTTSGHKQRATYIARGSLFPWLTCEAATFLLLAQTRQTRAGQVLRSRRGFNNFFSSTVWEVGRSLLTNLLTLPEQCWSVGRSSVYPQSERACKHLLVCLLIETKVPTITSEATQVNICPGSSWNRSEHKISLCNWQTPRLLFGRQHYTAKKGV